MNAFLVETVQRLFEMAWPWAGALASLTIKITALLMFGGALALAARRATAAARHLIWTGTIIGLLLMPVLLVVLPAWRILPDWKSSSVQPSASSDRETVDTRLIPSVPSAASVVQPHDAPSQVMVSPQPAKVVPGNTSAAAKAVGPEHSQTPLRLGLIVIIWTMGALLGVIPLLVSPWVLHRVKRRSSRLIDSRWVQLCDDLRGSLRLSRRVALLRTLQRSVPLTFGIVRPSILLPAEAESWSLDRRRLVLVHELAHVKRLDCLTQFLARIARAFFWFHPLVWLACSRMSRECERACDDIVLRTGTRSVDYASELLSIAANFQNGGYGDYAALGMARPSTLEGRLRAIMDAGRNRRKLAFKTGAAILLLLAGLMLPLACMKARTADQPTQTFAAKTAAPVPDESSEWGNINDSLRCRWIPLQGPVVLGTRPTVTVEVENAGRETVLWECGTGGTWMIATSGVTGRGSMTMPQYTISTDEKVRPATEGEILAKSGVGPQIPRGDAAPMPGYFALSPGGKIQLHAPLPDELPKSGRYQIESKVARINLRSNVDYPQEVGTISCPPMVLSVVAKGSTNIPAEDPTNWVAGEWGPAVDGMQLRLSPDKTFLNPGASMPGLFIDARNVGARAMRLSTALGNVDIELDGVWYAPIMDRSASTRGFGPGNRWEGVKVDASSPSNYGNNDLKPLAFGPGKHTIRVAVTLIPADGGHNVRLVSNAMQPLCADPFVARLQSALPENWSILRIQQDTYPSYRPEGKGMAIFLTLAGAKRGPMSFDYDAAVYVMPANYEDGGVDPTNGQAQGPPARLIGTTSRAKYYLLGGAGDEAIDGIVTSAINEKAATQPATRTATPETGTVKFSGHVEDAETGKPVEHFALQWGWSVDSSIGWGGMKVSSSAFPGGKFSESSSFEKGKQVWLRIVAEGYVSEPVTSAPLVVPADATDLVVKMRHGATLNGIVLDHAGKPVAGAGVQLTGDMQINALGDGLHRGEFVTDANGRFSISGAAKDQGLVVTAPFLLAWYVKVADPAKEVTIHLPEPAVLKVAYDIPGAPPAGELYIELKTWELPPDPATPQWKNVSVQWHEKLKNGAGKPTENDRITPGIYDVARIKQLRIGDMGKGILCDRATVTFTAGKTTELAFVRTRGAPITGKVEGLNGLPGAFIYVRSANATGDPRAKDEWKLKQFDGQVCGVDGAFKTELIPPGTYTVSVEAYGPDQHPNNSGSRLPDLFATAKVTVPENGAPTPATIQLRPLPPAAP